MSGIHAKRIAIINAQIARLCRCTYATIRIINNQSVSFRQERVGNGSSLVGTSVPNDFLRGVGGNCLVHSNGVELLVGGAGSEDIYGGRGCLQRGVVPGKGYVVPDFVVLRSCSDGGSKEGDTAGWVGGIVGSGGGSCCC